MRRLDDHQRARVWAKLIALQFQRDILNILRLAPSRESAIRALQGVKDAPELVRDSIRAHIQRVSAWREPPPPPSRYTEPVLVAEAPEWRPFATSEVPHETACAEVLTDTLVAASNAPSRAL